jgi:predicted phage baseplate assembly protein
LTFADPYDPTAAANAALNSRVVDGLLPAVSLTDQGGYAWTVVEDLLDADPNDKLFVAEVDNNGGASLRFGDSQYGMAPVTDTAFYAFYRVGNGSAGNIGANALALVATNNPALLSEPSNPVITKVTNPLPASGGLDPQPLSQVRQLAPIAFRTQERAVTEQDYGTMALQVDPSLAKAMGTFRWTGSWQTVFISADPEGTETLPAEEASLIQTGMELYRMAGHDVAVVSPIYVSLELHMKVCVQPGYVASDVEQALLGVLSNRILPDGTVGAFYPDNFTFGQTVYLSPIYALVQSTAGVDSVNITRFQRQGQCATNAVSTGALKMDQLEIARLDNDPNYPNHGTLKLCVAGGQ